MRRELQQAINDKTLCITYSKARGVVINVIMDEFNMPEAVEMTYNSQSVVITPLTVYVLKPFPYNSSTNVP